MGQSQINTINELLIYLVGGMFLIIGSIAGYWVRDITKRVNVLDKIGVQFSNLVELYEKHEIADKERFEEITRRLDHNRNSVHEIRNTLSNMGMKSILQQKRQIEES